MLKAVACALQSGIGSAPSLPPANEAPVTHPNLAPLLDPLADIALAAGEEILKIYAFEFSAEEKADGSPVTAADKAAERVILARLHAFNPTIPILSEEQAAAGHIPALDDIWWCVDPLDGTKEFLKRNDEFVVSIGLIAGGRPVAGVIYAPALKELYAGTGGTVWVADQKGRRAISARRPPADGAVALVSRSHRDAAETDAKLAELGVREQIAMGSALKFARLAAGGADVYLRLGPTSEWDIAGGQAVLEAAGGRVTAPDGSALAYGKAPRFLNPGFIARGLV